MTARRPRYGGTLRVEIGTALNSVDPAVTAASAEAAAKQQLDALLYDHRGADGAFTGTGAFRISAWDPGKRVVLAANDDSPEGRPFLDAVDVLMAVPARQRLLDLELGHADLAEIPAEETRQATASGIRVSASAPDELVAIAFVPGRKLAADERARESLSRAIDRVTIAGFLLQKEGEPAGGILPQWCSGTAFLFSTAPDTATARRLWSQIPGSPRLVLGYDSDDSLERTIAERIVVNARDAAIDLTAEPATSAGSNFDARLIRWRMPSAHPRAALTDFLGAAGPRAGLDLAPLADPASPEQVFARESQIVGGFRVIPLVWLPHVYGLGARVRNWKAPVPGDSWPLASVWLAEEAP